MSFKLQDLYFFANAISHHDIETHGLAGTKQGTDMPNILQEKGNETTSFQSTSVCPILYSEQTDF